MPVAPAPFAWPVAADSRVSAAELARWVGIAQQWRDLYQGVGAKEQEALRVKRGIRSVEAYIAHARRQLDDAALHLATLSKPAARRYKKGRA